MEWKTNRDWQLKFAWFPTQLAYDQWVWWEPYEYRKRNDGCAEYRRRGAAEIGIYGPD